ncbi:ankyrin repeat domain-containing protein [Ottowia testudinis]|uniref:Ankyrin repeat domain-containing protein n=1 Tax=Ottowia testudinis TaxID=2816950 RepID=A0A975CGC7_9BURK|nr:ankyrin repeat domain-containing protein [Ottowia testudinis]QTD45700.1 ankyrin repeat domain-containing protein [Ottowia testudinis]
MREEPRSDERFGSPQAAALYAAAARGELDRARQLMAQGVSLDAANAREMTLLETAMREGNRRAFDNLLALGANPVYLGSHRDTPMHFAAILTDPYWLKTLLARGADTEVRNRLGETPLFRALGQEANVQLLLDAGADIHAHSRSRETLLHKAAATLNYAQVVRFLELGVDPRATDDLGGTFQRAFFMARESLLNDSAKAARAKVRAWLRERGIAVEDAGQR